jgi:RNA polymerase sigma factor (sigma-70 family)
MKAKKTRNRTGSHCWFAMEGDFQTVWSKLREGIGSRCKEFRDAEAAIRQRLEATAGAIFGDLKYRSIDCHPEDAVKAFYAEKVPGLLERYVPGSPLYAYVYDSFVKFCLSKRKYGNRRVGMEYSSELADAVLFETNADEASLSDEDKAQIHASLARLSPIQRDAIYAMHWDELPAKEIGKHCNKSEGAINSLVYRGYDELRILLDNLRLQFFRAKPRKKLAG